MATSKNKIKVSTSKRRSATPPVPEVKFGYGNAGRDTMAAIEEELTTGTSSSRAEAPVVEVSEAPAGRETLAAISLELAGGARPRQDTLPYADRISNARGARSPSRAPTPPTAQATPQALEIFELLTFIVRGRDAAELSTEALRRAFVSEHLLHRVPSGSIEAVE